MTSWHVDKLTKLQEHIWLRALSPQIENYYWLTFKSLYKSQGWSLLMQSSFNTHRSHPSWPLHRREGGPGRHLQCFDSGCSCWVSWDWNHHLLAAQVGLCCCVNWDWNHWLCKDLALNDKLGVGMCCWRCCVKWHWSHWLCKHLAFDVQAGEGLCCRGHRWAWCRGGSKGCS